MKRYVPIISVSLLIVAGFVLIHMIDPSKFMGTAEEFITHMTAYQTKTWFITVIGYILTGIAVYLLFTKREAGEKVTRNDKLIASIFAIFWLNEGLVHQWLFGPEAFEPGAFMFVTLPFIIQGILSVIFGVVKPVVSFKYEGERPDAQLGMFLVIYGAILYPIAAYFTGIAYPRAPALPIVCAMSNVQFGFFLWSKKLPKFLLIVPCYWAVLGGMLAVVDWYWWPDIFLVASGVAGTILVAGRPSHASAVK